MAFETTDGVEVYHTARGVQYVDADEVVRTDQMQRLLEDCEEAFDRLDPSKGGKNGKERDTSNENGHP